MYTWQGGWGILMVEINKYKIHVPKSAPKLLYNHVQKHSRSEKYLNLDMLGSAQNT